MPDVDDGRVMSLCAHAHESIAFAVRYGTAFIVTGTWKDA
ncbi:hypothetical protein GRAN_2455 [Granulicella sibirica]|uniref:Uncharacterized protein n=1 Tax=Granulicella sibirica TaxID=2479048 RepID=A0A4Q0T0W7_9BACT|nr:hypothetical protein GRAN_2455 [Granulicella sibirica]